jgi:hypothetical protein
MTGRSSGVLAGIGVGAGDGDVVEVGALDAFPFGALEWHPDSRASKRNGSN